MVELERFRGCLLGLALGDAIGAPFEGGVLERLIWRAICLARREELRWTDDTQMTLDVIASYLAQGQIDADDLACRFAKSYRWSRGYGPAAAKVLKRISKGADWRTANRSVYKDGSYGNGAAMRAPLLGLIFENQPKQLASAAHTTGIVTHAHPVGLEGSLLMAAVTGESAQSSGSREIMLHALELSTLQQYKSRLELALRWLESAEDISAGEVRRHLGNGIAAHESVVTAIYLALRYRQKSFLAMQRFAIEIRGDVDTIGAMSGAIWGAANGYSSLPADSLAVLEQRERLENLAEQLYLRVNARQSDLS